MPRIGLAQGPQPLPRPQNPGMPPVTNRTLLRFAPAVTVAALLCLAAAAPQPQGAGPAPPPQLQPRCDEFASAVAGDSSVLMREQTGVEQALPAGMSVAACSLRADQDFSSRPTIVLRDWDPTTLAPDPGTIALRRAFFDPSNLQWSGGKLPLVRFVPPVVNGSIPGVAEPPKPQIAMQLMNAASWVGTGVKGYFNPDGPAGLPAAARFDADGLREPLPGPHPVLAHAVCGGSDDFASLRVVQSVTRTDVKPFPMPKEFLQKFRVPQETELRWVELALGEVFSPYFETAGDGENFFAFTDIPVLAIVDGNDMPRPTPVVPRPLVEARFDLGALFSGGMTWISHLDLDRTVTLEPGHDYWIYVRNSARTTFLNRRVRGTESRAFAAGIGRYFARPDTAGGWTQAADQILAFRIVGKPIAPPEPPPVPRPTPAPGPPVPSPSAFALNTTPNPAPGAVRVEWSGAVGPVRFDVLDARGRRVAEGSGGAAGSWTWPGTGRDGRPVASGVYFVRARDSAGQLSTQRVMIVR